MSRSFQSRQDKKVSGVEDEKRMTRLLQGLSHGDRLTANGECLDAETMKGGRNIGA
jgi:hypothetical protein